MSANWRREAEERQNEICKRGGIDLEYAKAWWKENEEMLYDKVANNLDIETMVLQILAKNYVPIKSKNYTLLNDVKKFVEDRLSDENGITVKITMKKLKMIMTTLDFEPVKGTGNKVWLIQFLSHRHRIGFE